MTRYSNLLTVLVSLLVLSGTLQATFTVSLLPRTGAYDVGQLISITAQVAGTTIAAPYTYTLYDETTGTQHQISSVSTNSPSAQFSIIAQTNSTKYEVGVKDAKTNVKNVSNSSDTNFKINSALAAGSITPLDQMIDLGQNLKLYSNKSGGSSPYSYQWYTSIGTSATECNQSNLIPLATSATYLASPITTNSYSYQITDSANPPVSVCSNASTIYVMPQPSISIEPQPAALDINQSILLNSTVNGGSSNYTWQWYRDGKLSDGAGNGTVATYNASVAGNYHVVFTDIGTGSATPVRTATAQSVPVKVTTALLKPTLFASNSTLDLGQAETLTEYAVGGTPDYTYKFTSTSPKHFVIPACSLILNNTCTFTPNALSVYTASVTDAGAKPVTKTSNSISITVNPVLSITSFSASNSSISSGSLETLTVSAVGGTPNYSYTFTDLNASSPIPGCDLISTNSCTFTPSSTDSYGALVSDSASTPVSISSAPILVSVAIPLATPVLSSSNASVDLGQSITLTSTVSGGTSAYTTTFINLNTSSPISGCIQISTNTCSFIPVESATYAATLISNVSNKTTTTSVPITVIVFSLPTLSANGATSADAGQIITLESNLTDAGSGSVRYQWYNNTLPIADANSSTYSATAGATGSFNYSVIATDSNGGAGESNTISVTVFALPTATLIGTTSADVGQPIAFYSNITSSGSGSISYQWYEGSAQIINATQPDYASVAASSGLFNYSVLVTDSNGGATRSSSKNLSIFALPVIKASGTSTADFNQAINLSSNLTTSGSGSITYQWYNKTTPITGATSSNYNSTAGALGEFNYTVIATDSNGGVGQSNIASLTVFALPNVIISGGASIISGQSIALVSNMTNIGSGSLTYQWYNGSTLIINATAPVYTQISGTAGIFNYTLVVTDSNGGLGTSNMAQVIVYPSSLEVSEQPQAALIDNGQSITLQSAINAPAGSYSWQWYSNNSPILDATGNGTIATYSASTDGNYDAIFTESGTEIPVTGTSSYANVVLASPSIISPKLDVHAVGGGLTHSPITTSLFSTSSANDIVMLILMADGGSGSPSVLDSAGLNWTLQYGGEDGISGECSNTWVYYSAPGKILNGDAVTATLSNATYLGAFVIAASNVTGFDENATLPSVGLAPTGTVASTRYSTSNANDLVFGASSTCHPINPTVWGGLNSLDQGSQVEFADSYQIVSSKLTSATATATQPNTVNPSIGIFVGALEGTNIVHHSPAISREPSNAAVDLGQTATLISNVTGGTGNYLWQWYENNAIVIGATGSGTSATYATSNAGTYSVIFTDVGTSAFATPIENATSISVNVTNYPAPVISVQPQAAIIDSGQLIKLNSTISGGTGNYLWQWYNSGNAIIGATGNTITAIYSANTQGDYNVVFKDVGTGLSAPAENLSSTFAQLNVNSSFSISNQPLGGVIQNGNPVILTSAVSGGTGNYLWQWYSVGNGLIAGAVGSAATATYSVSVAGSYYVVFKDAGVAALATPSENLTSVSASVTTHVVLPIKLDAHASGGGLMAPPITTSAFTTNSANDILIAIAMADGGSGIPTVTDSAGLTWTLEYGGANGLSGECGTGWVYYATPSKKLTSDVLTVKRTGATYAGAFVIAVANATVFDTNSTLPSIALSSGNSASTRYSTSNANDLIFGIASSCHASPFNWNGLTALDSAANEYGDSYSIVSNRLNSANALVSGGTDIGIAVQGISSI